MPPKLSPLTHTQTNTHARAYTHRQTYIHKKQVVKIYQGSNLFWEEQLRSLCWQNIKITDINDSCVRSGLWSRWKTETRIIKWFACVYTNYIWQSITQICPLRNNLHFAQKNNANLSLCFLQRNFHSTNVVLH